MLQRVKILSLLLAGVLLMNACSDSVSSSKQDTPPKMPPAESMNMDLSTFDENEPPSQVNNETSEVTNFAQAVIRAALMKVVVDANLALPRAIFKAAAEADANLNEENEWEWSFTKTVNGNTFEVRFVGTRQDENTILWECYITNTEKGFDDVLLFEGTSNNDGTEGTWTYYNIQNTQEQEAVSQISWSKTETSTTLTLEVISENSPHFGNTIEYLAEGNIRHATFYNASEDQTTELHWNLETLAGYLIAPNYNNGEKACWDSNFQNVPCSGE